MPPSPLPGQPGAPSDSAPWLLWGPYLSERQWGTVREDASVDSGDVWRSVTHDMARSVAYRWGEEGIGGVSDERQRLCLALSLWNGQDPILKERMFGLSNEEGNHGEDVKEVYHYLDNVPDHRWMHMLYRYPHRAFPYNQLVQENARRNRLDPEYELADTGVFDDNRFFDVDIEVAKADTRDILIRYTATNRGASDATLHLLPTLWFRQDVEPTDPHSHPCLEAAPDRRSVVATHPEMGSYTWHAEGDFTLLLTDNATNPKRAAESNAQGWIRSTSDSPRDRYKDGIGEFVVNGNADAVHAGSHGTKASAWFRFTVPAGGQVVVRTRLRAANVVNAASRREPDCTSDPFEDYDAVMQAQSSAADAFYAEHQDAAQSKQRRAVQRQAWAGLLWSKQFYSYDVSKWLDGEIGRAAGAAPDIVTNMATGDAAAQLAKADSPKSRIDRHASRNRNWRHLRAHDVILMPDKWEYPWFAAWDLAFHCIAIAPIDPQLAKRQITLLLHDRYMHPNGQLPAYEWNFNDVNPPVQAIAAWRVYQVDLAATGVPDTAFLRHVLHRLMLNFTWWVNREDSSGNNIFEGGFLGLDNVGVFDRSRTFLDGTTLEQADGTSWMAMYALNLMRIAMELTQTDAVYEDLAIKFAEHFFYIAGAMANMGNVEGEGLWDEEDGFYYDLLQLPNGQRSQLKLRTIAGLIPLFAVEVLDEARMSKLGKLQRHLEVFLKGRPDLAALVSYWAVPNKPSTAGQPAKPADFPAATPEVEANGNLHLFSLLRGHRMKRVLKRMLDPNEFLSDHGIRSVSKAYCEHAFDYELGGVDYALQYTPAESDTSMFGGNSNWRGPVWMPVNYLIVESLRRFHSYYGDDFKVECPTGSGQMMSIGEVADFLKQRLLTLMLPDENGRRVGCTSAAQGDALLFHEYFNGDTGAGLGASHQTGWTALLAVL